MTGFSFSSICLQIGQKCWIPGFVPKLQASEVWFCVRRVHIDQVEKLGFKGQNATFGVRIAIFVGFKGVFLGYILGNSR